MKAILISIHPKYCKLITDGEKTIEVRKSFPKQLKTPFKCFIYCTKPSKKYQTICGCTVINTDELYRLPSGEIKHDSSIELMACDIGEYSKDNFLNGKIISEFSCDKIAELDYVRYWNNGYENDTCLTYEEIAEYGKGMPLYGWHISDLKIYNRPKELGEFKGICPLAYSCISKGITCNDKHSQTYTKDINGYCAKRLSRPPRSWCYVEAEE